MPSKPSRPEDLLRTLAAVPRATGSGALRSARDRCAAELTSLGFLVRERPFGFSSFPGRFGTPLLGFVAAITVATACHFGARGERWIPLGMLAVVGALVGMVGPWLSRHGVLTLPLFRASGVNLEATLPDETPRVWLCAHLDTKSQPIPTLVRTAGVMVLVPGTLAAAALALVAAMGRQPAYGLWVAATIVTLVGAIPVVSSVVGSRSPGALDNASGVVTVLEAARQMGDARGFGVLLTDAEELGLAGARAWARDRSAAIVLNCDGVDDGGAINVLFSGRAPSRVLRAATAASQERRTPQRSRRIPFGILMDSVAFADAGLEAVTFSRGSYRSLVRVHRPADSLQNLTGAGIDETAALISATARMLLQQGGPQQHDGVKI